MAKPLALTLGEPAGIGPDITIKAWLMEKSFADSFAADWIKLWNAHDLERILAHYADDFDRSSPMISNLLAINPARSGKAAVRAYWSAAPSTPQAKEE